MTPRHTILLLAVFNFLCWTLLPFLFERALRLDVAEAASFGSEYLFAYAKHPPLSFWLTALAAKWGSGSHLAIHALGASFAGVAHYILARYCLAAFPARIGIVAAIFGVVSPFATYLSIQFNHNVALMPFWAATLICALEAFEHNKTRDWLLLGVFIGLGIWAKYAIALLCVPLAVACLLVPEWRRVFRSFKVYLSFSIFVALAMPHFIAAFDSGGHSFGYAMRIWPSDFLARFLNALLIVYMAALSNAFLFVIVCCAVGFRQGLQVPARMWQALKGGDRRALFFTFAAFGPIAIIFCASFIGVRARSHWIGPVTLSFAMWWCYALTFVEDKAIKLNKLALAAAAMILLHIVGYMSARFVMPHYGHLRYPEIDGARLTQIATEVWVQHSTTELRTIIIAGEQRTLQVAGTIAFNLGGGIRVRYRDEVGGYADLPKEALVINVDRNGHPEELPATIGPYHVEETLRAVLPRVRGKGGRASVSFGMARR